MVFLMILLLLVQISVNDCCSEINSRGVCAVEGLSLDDLIRGGSVTWITTITCYSCKIGVIDDASIHQLWTDYPNLRTIIFSFDGPTLCKTTTTLIKVEGCIELEKSTPSPYSIIGQTTPNLASEDKDDLGIDYNDIFTPVIGLLFMLLSVGVSILVFKLRRIYHLYRLKDTKLQTIYNTLVENGTISIIEEPSTPTTPSRYMRFRRRLLKFSTPKVPSVENIEMSSVTHTQTVDNVTQTMGSLASSIISQHTLSESSLKGEELLGAVGGNIDPYRSLELGLFPRALGNVDTPTADCYRVSWKTREGEYYPSYTPSKPDIEFKRHLEWINNRMINSKSEGDIRAGRNNSSECVKTDFFQ